MTYKNITKYILYSILLLFFFYFLIINILMPLTPDDFSRATVSHTGKKITNIWDIVYSQYYFYQVVNGRAIVHAFVELFMMLGKDLFNIINSLVFISLCVLILIHSGIKEINKFVGFHFILVVILLWFGLPSIGDTIFWLSGSVNYLWTAVFSLSFLLPFRFAIEGKELLNSNKKAHILMLVLGLLAGWSHENTAMLTGCFLFFIFLYFWFGKIKIARYLYTGALSFVIGALFLFLAPANFNRVKSMGYTDNYDLWRQVKIGFESIKYILKSSQFIFVLFFFLILIYIWTSKRSRVKNNKAIIQVLIYFSAACVSIIPMLVSPEFPPRSFFASATFVVISIVMLYRVISTEINSSLKVISLFILGILLVMSMSRVYLDYNKIHETHTAREALITESKQKGIYSVSLPKMPLATDKYIFVYEINKSPDYIANGVYAQYYDLDSVVLEGDYLKVYTTDDSLAGWYKIYYDSGQSFREKESTYVIHATALDKNQLYFNYPETEIKQLRLDFPASATANVTIEKIVINQNGVAKEIDMDKLGKNIQPVSGILNYSVDKSVLKISIEGENPHLIIRNFNELVETTK
ncbi:hypothetical protein PC41400_05090 [Paenibacillus chitinolyticus]|uniref:DUF6056 family protein n=1 Tax=Paenibacillus chitinolyticus TaxID=79263 RepID=A0A410WRP2_9BACL|nr:DUF6056 family protein [Paenibacillus chitinolyticus]MCY9592015.1 DUF6056 family protein [Paenibacillus chitinolyticus]MCY9598888.1 DUF6056 family protein [Paenibacillus chitinolyticus]QAV17089.1 hypothetical protein PC41400_05090 [Paenibacillus chitinolyticus]